MEDDFQKDEIEKEIKQKIEENEEHEKDIEEREEIGDFEDYNEINKINKIDKSQINNQNIIKGNISKNERNYFNSTKKHNLAQNNNKSLIHKNNQNSMNLKNKNKIQNFSNNPSQTRGINENIFINRIPNSNFNNSLLFNDNSYNNQNKMLTPNYKNIGRLKNFNNLNQSQNIFPNYSPLFNNFNPYNSYINNDYWFQDYIKIQNELIELKKLIFQRQLFNNNQQTYINFNDNNASPFIPQEYEGEEEEEEEEEEEKEKEKEAKYRKEIYSIYNSNLNKANQAIQNKHKNFEYSKENLKKQEIIIYITNNKELQFIERLNKIKGVRLNDIKIPNITYEMIETKITNNKYEMTKEDNILLNDYKKNLGKNFSSYFYNKYMFYSQANISLFTPHIIKSKKSIISLFLPGKLSLSDFQYTDFHNNINNDIFLSLLKLRIDQFNTFDKNDGKITDKNYNERIFGFNTNKGRNNFYLYSIMDKKIISDKLQNYNIETLFENLTAAQSQVDQYQKEDSIKCYEIFNRNMNFLKGLSYEEIILYIILDKIENNYESFPRIMFYEYYLTINGERVVVSDNIQTGYSEIDCVIYSKCNHIYEEEPLLVQKKYNNNYNNFSFSNGKFEIKENTLYFIELKSSFNFSEEEDKLKKLSKYRDFFTKLFNKYKEFVYLYESKGWIKKDTKKEILLIYDNDIIEISTEIEEIINKLFKENPDCTFRIVYTLKFYPFFSHIYALEKNKQLTEKYDKMSMENKKREEEMLKKFEEILKESKKREEESKKREEESKKREEESKKREEELSKKIEEILKENKEIKEQLDNLSKRNGNKKTENNEKKSEESQNVESKNNEIEINITNNN